MSLAEKEMSLLKGVGVPGTCSCGCSSGNTTSNCNANDLQGYTISSQNPDTSGCCTCGSKDSFNTYLISNPI